VAGSDSVAALNAGRCRTVWNDVAIRASMAEVRVTKGADGVRRDAAFGPLVGPRLDRAYGLAWHLLGNAADAEDASQEALLAAWSGWPRLRDADRFDAWFDRIVVNTCLEQLRRRSRRPRSPLPDEPGIPARDPYAASIERDAVGRALGQLDPDHRAVVVLRCWADLSTDDVAERLGVPPGTVRSRLHYALGTLRAALADQGGSR
jgi:RNA polymerase sigma-70 factor, ECF subfamily